MVISTYNSQETYNSWFFSKVDQLKEIPFFWQDAKKINHTHNELGLAQKFINLMIKDWWCVSKNSEKADVTMIHAPFDNVMWNV